MKTYWENDGKPLSEGDHAGQYCAVVDPEEAELQPSRYYGATEKEVADKLLVAQGNAYSRIAQLKQERQPDAARAEAQERGPLTADQRLEMARAITDPARLDEVVGTAVESQLGAPLAKVRELLNADEAQKRHDAIVAEAGAFARSEPDFFPSEYNKQLVVDYIQLKGYPFTRKNFSIAFDNLRRAGLVQMRPQGEEQPGAGLAPQPAVTPEPTAQPDVVRRPRGVLSSSGTRSQDASGGAGGGQRAKLTRADVAAMSTRVLKERIANEPGFAEALEGLAEQGARI